MLLPKRLHSLDISRGIAAYCVIFWHWQHFFYEGDHLSKYFDKQNMPLYDYLSILYNYGYCAVSFFFMLSGFIFFWLYYDKISSKKCSFKEFAILRLARLYPLHLITLLLVLFLQIVYYNLSNSNFVYTNNDSLHFILNLFLVSYWKSSFGYSFNGPTWSISIEIGLYLIFYLFCKIPLNKIIKLSIIIIASSVILYLKIYTSWPLALASFYLGGLTYEISKLYLKYRSKNYDLIITSVTLSCWILTLVSEDARYYLLTRDFDNVYFLFPISIISLIILEIRFSKFCRKLAWIGDISYSSYLWHFPLQLICQTIVFTMGYNNKIYTSPLSIFTFLALTTFVSVLSYKWIEKPLQNFIRKYFISS